MSLCAMNSLIVSEGVCDNSDVNGEVISDNCEVNSDGSVKKRDTSSEVV